MDQQRERWKNDRERAIVSNLKLDGDHWTVTLDYLLDRCWRNVGKSKFWNRSNVFWIRIVITNWSTVRSRSSSAPRMQRWNRHLDFKYFEDPTDEIRDPMGTLHPLWKFPPTVSNRSVTALTWNPAYPDMLVIGYGLCKSWQEEKSITMLVSN